MHTREMLEQFLELPLELSSKFTHLFDNYSSLYKSILPRFFAHFPSLVSLSLDILTTWTLSELTNCLSQLKNLTFLKLIIGCPSDSFISKEERYNERDNGKDRVISGSDSLSSSSTATAAENCPSIISSSITASTLKPLISVKILKICMDFECHHDIDRLRLPAIFPSLNYIDIVADRPFKCLECAAAREELQNSQEDQMKNKNGDDKVQPQKQANCKNGEDVQMRNDDEGDAQDDRQESNEEENSAVASRRRTDDSCLALLLEPIERMQNTTPLLAMTYTSLWPAY